VSADEQAAAGLVIGDTTHGYIVTVATGELRREIEAAAALRGVPCSVG
jgi:hypothetical protein